MPFAICDKLMHVATDSARPRHGIIDVLSYPSITLLFFIEACYNLLQVIMLNHLNIYILLKVLFKDAKLKKEGRKCFI